jgi:hypothetical protein
MPVGLGKEIDHAPTAYIKSGYVYRREMNLDSPDNTLAPFTYMPRG